MSTVLDARTFAELPDDLPGLPSGNDIVSAATVRPLDLVAEFAQVNGTPMDLRAQPAVSTDGLAATPSDGEAPVHEALDAAWLAHPHEKVDFTVSVDVRGRGRRASLRLLAERRYHDPPAVLVVGRTGDGLVEFRITIDPRRRAPISFHMSPSDLEGADPEHAWPILEFLALSKSPHEFSIGLPSRPPRWNPIPSLEAPVDGSLTRLVLQLRTVQRHTGIPLPIPAAFPTSLSSPLGMAAKLISGATVPGRWTSAEVVMTSNEAAALDLEGQFRVELHAPLTFMIDGRKIEIDRWARLHRVRFGAKRIAPDGVSIMLEPAGDDRVDSRRGPWLAPEEQQPPISIGSGDWVAMLGDAVVASSSDLGDLKAVLAAGTVKPDMVVRNLPSDMPGML